MRYFKYLEDNQEFIESIQKDDRPGEGNITEAEYNQILYAMQHCPPEEPGYYFKLQDITLIWIKFKEEPQPEPEIKLEE